MIVADASAVVEWLLGGARGEAAARALEEEDVYVPGHLDVEVAQVVRRLTLDAGVITPGRGRAMIELLAEAPLRRVPLAPLLPGIWALRTNLTAYDAAYVVLAEALEAPLVTFDKKIPSAPGHRARVLVPEEGRPVRHLWIKLALLSPWSQIILPEVEMVPGRVR